jgi:hypothetical protein
VLGQFEQFLILAGKEEQWTIEEAMLLPQKINFARTTSGPTGIYPIPSGRNDPTAKET